MDIPHLFGNETPVGTLRARWNVRPGGWIGDPVYFGVRDREIVEV